MSDLWVVPLFCGLFVAIFFLLPRLAFEPLSALGRRWYDLTHKLTEPPPHAVLELVDEGFVTRWRKGPPEQTRFADIQEVWGFKRDEITTDSICFNVCTVESGTERVHLIDEDMPGWDGVRDRLTAMPGFDQQWFSKLAFPAFEVNLTLLYWRGQDMNQSPPDPATGDVVVEP